MTLKELLIEKNVTQKKLAKETGISTSTISNYVSGATNISKRNLKKIADYFGIPEEKLERSINCREDKKQIFAENLRKVLKEERMSQTELAKRIGISVSGVNKYLKGTAVPTALTLCKMIEVLGISADRLLGNAEAVERAKYAEAGLYLIGVLKGLSKKQREDLIKLIKSLN